MPRLPSKGEREARLGTPKAPKMGGLTPKRIEVSPVDDLLRELNEVVPSMELRFIGMDWGAKKIEVKARCHINCSCPPCRRGECSGCYVERERYNDTHRVRALAAEYRGVIYE